MTIKKIGYFQEGGAMPAGDPAAAAGGGDIMQLILQAAALAVQAQDCQIALQVCQVLVQMAQGGAPQGGAPAEAPAEAPMARRGGRLTGGPKYRLSDTKLISK